MVARWHAVSKLTQAQLVDQFKMGSKKWNSEEEHALIEFIAFHVMQYTTDVKSRFYHQSAFSVLAAKTAVQVKSK